MVNLDCQFYSWSGIRREKGWGKCQKVGRGFWRMLVLLRSTLLPFSSPLIHSPINLLAQAETLGASAASAMQWPESIWQQLLFPAALKSLGLPLPEYELQQCKALAGLGTKLWESTDILYRLTANPTYCWLLTIALLSFCKAGTRRDAPTSWKLFRSPEIGCMTTFSSLHPLLRFWLTDYTTLVLTGIWWVLTIISIDSIWRLFSYL